MNGPVRVAVAGGVAYSGVPHSVYVLPFTCFANPKSVICAQTRISHAQPYAYEYEIWNMKNDMAALSLYVRVGVSVSNKHSKYTGTRISVSPRAYAKTKEAKLLIGDSKLRFHRVYCTVYLQSIVLKIKLLRSK